VFVAQAGPLYFCGGSHRTVAFRFSLVNSKVKSENSPSNACLTKTHIAKVDQLMTLCEQLEAKLHQAEPTVNFDECRRSPCA
jgi:hypothetical protein